MQFAFMPGNENADAVSSCHLETVTGDIIKRFWEGFKGNLRELMGN